MADSVSGDQLPSAGSAFDSSVPKPQRLRELRAAGERDRAERAREAERVRDALRQSVEIRRPGLQRPGERPLRRARFLRAASAAALTPEAAQEVLAWRKAESERRRADGDV